MRRELRKALSGGEFRNVPAQRSRTMSAIRSSNNATTEVAFRMALVRSRIGGWKIGNNLPGRPDIIFPFSRVAIFLDGCFWHGCRRCGHVPKVNTKFWQTKIRLNRSRDRRIGRLLRNDGFHVVRVWEHTIASHSALSAMLKKLREFSATAAKNEHK